MGDITNYAIPFFFITLLAELSISLYGKRKFYTTNDTFASLSMGIGSIVASLFSKGIKFTVFTFL